MDMRHRRRLHRDTDRLALGMRGVRAAGMAVVVAVIMVLMRMTMVVAMSAAIRMGRRIDHAQRAILGHQHITGVQMGALRQLNLQRLALFVGHLQRMLVALRFVQLDDRCPLEQGRGQALAAGQAFGDEEGGQRCVWGVHVEGGAVEALQLNRALQCSELASAPPAKP